MKARQMKFRDNFSKYQTIYNFKYTKYYPIIIPQLSLVTASRYKFPLILHYFNLNVEYQKHKQLGNYIK